MIELGIFTTKDGRKYKGHFFPDIKTVETVGPLPIVGVGARGEAFSKSAKSEQEAIQIIKEAINQGVLR